MSELGSISQYVLNIQKVQMSIIKNQAEMQQAVAEILLDNTTGSVPPSEVLGTQIDVSI